MPPRSHPACRLPPHRTDTNLVISFSDDETSDDCGHPNKDKTSEVKGFTSRMIGNRKTLSPIKSSVKSIPIVKNKVKSIPKKTSLSRTFMLSNSKASRTNSTPPQLFSFREATHMKHRNPNKKIPGPEHGSNQNTDLTNSELQNLRHRIALRENELKLKARKQNKIVSYVSVAKNPGTNCSDSDTLEAAKEIKETVTDSIILNTDAIRNSKKSSPDIVSVPFISNNDSAKSPRTNFSDIEELEAQGPEKKRMKVNEPSTNLCADDNRAIPTSMSVITAVEPVIMGSDQGYTTVCDSFCNKEYPLEQTTFNATKRKELSDKPAPVSSGNFPSADVTVKDCQAGKYSELPYLYSDTQSPQPTNATSLSLSLNHDVMDSRHRSRIIQHNPSSIHEKDPIGTNELEFQSITPTCNISNNANNFVHNDEDMLSLIEREETNDRELEEALEVRRNCEIEEMTAFRFYRKAQRALIEANGRCSHLYRKRDMHSAHLQSVMTGDPGLLESLRQYRPLVNTRLKPPSNDTNAYTRAIPITAHLVQNELNIYNPVASESYIQLVEDAAAIANTNNTGEYNSGIEACCEPSATISEPEFQQIITCNGDYSPSNVHNVSADDDQGGIPLAHKNAPASLEFQVNKEKGMGNEQLMHALSVKGSSLYDRLTENLNQIASLRSESLPFSVKQSLKNSNHTSFMDHQGTETHRVNNEGEKVQKLTNDALSHDVDEKGKLDHPVESEPYNGAVTVFAPQLLYWSALYHMKAKSAICLHKKGPENHVAREEHFQDPDNSEKIVSEESKHKVHPFWPICMFELRGKCNDSKCPWQHARDSSQPDNSSHPVGNVHPKYVCAFRALSNSQQSSFLFDGSIVNGSDYQNDDIEGNLNRQSIYFLGRKDGLDQFRQGLVGNEHILEMAFFALNQDPSKSYSVKKVLNILSRALEANPTSVILWVVYLHIFYHNKKPVLKDDMFIHAVKHNEESYELWLMYINSRVLLDDRISAYDSALAALCRHSLAPGSHPTHASSCILDVFLHMVDLYRMSGHTQRAVHRLNTSFLAGSDSGGPSSPSLQTLVLCLTVSDRCIFWACSVYLLLYRLLPPEILGRFERSKFLSLLHWPPPPPTLSQEERRRALALMEVATHSLGEEEDGGDHALVGSLHMFSVNRVLFRAALDGMGGALGPAALDQLVAEHPSCLELALMWARGREDAQGGPPFHRFEQVLGKWRGDGKSRKGVHHVWNQYAEHALRNGRSDLAADVLRRWAEDFSNHDLGLGIRPPAGDPAEAAFGFLNLSLYRLLLQSDEGGSIVAVKQALEKAGEGEDREGYLHAVREHAVLSFPGTDPSLVVEVLRGYGGDTGPGRGSIPLSRAFMAGVKKPRIRHLIDGMLGPTPPGFAAANVALETWFGPTGLPESGRVEAVVDIVESVMGLFPSYYELALSAYRLMKDTPGSPAGGLFWAGTVLLDALSRSIPKAPESAWVEAGRLLAAGGRSVVYEGFYEKALGEYPFSIALWDSYLAFSRVAGGGGEDSVLAACRARGIKLS